MFQQTVRFDLGFGVVGEIRLGYPVKSQMGVINSATAANNVIGRVFTQNPTTGNWAAGNVATTGVNPSVLGVPKQMSAIGTQAGGTLAPTLTVPNGQEGEFFSSGFINVALLSTTTPSLSDDLHYQIADGQILAVAPGTDPAEGNAVLQLSGVYMFPQPNAGGLCIANLRN